jgi:hypothetical protein
VVSLSRFKATAPPTLGNFLEATPSQPPHRPHHCRSPTPGTAVIAHPCQPPPSHRPRNPAYQCPGRLSSPAAITLAVGVLAALAPRRLSSRRRGRKKVSKIQNCLYVRFELECMNLNVRFELKCIYLNKNDNVVEYE